MTEEKKQPCGRKPYVRPQVMDVVGFNRQMLAASGSVVHVTINSLTDYYLASGCYSTCPDACHDFGEWGDINPWGWNPCDGGTITGWISAQIAFLVAGVRQCWHRPGTEDWEVTMRVESINRQFDEFKAQYAPSVSFVGADWDAADFMENAEFDACDGTEISGTYQGRRFVGTVNSGS